MAMQAPRRVTASDTPTDGLAWLLGAVHEIVHAHAGPAAACLFLPGDPGGDASGRDFTRAADDPGTGLCAAMDRDASAALCDALADAGVEVTEQLQPVRLMAPTLPGREHLLVLPLVWHGRTAGVLVVAAPAPPLGRAGLTRVVELAGSGLGWVTAAAETADRLDELHEERCRLDDELARTRMFLELQERLVAARTTSQVVSTLAHWLGAGVAVQMPTLIVADAAGPDARDLALGTGRSNAELAVLDRVAGSGELPALPATARTPARVIAPITGGDGEFSGFLVAAIGPRGLEATRRALRVSRGLIAYQMGVRQDIEASVATVRQTLLTDLLDGKATDDLSTRAAKLGHDLSVPHVPLAVGRTTGGPLAADADRLLRIVAQAAANASVAGVSALLGVVEDIVVAFIPEPVPAGGATLARVVVADAGAEGMEVVVGVGPGAPALQDMPAAGARARWAVHVLAATAGEGGPTSAEFDSLGIYGLLFDHRRSGDLVAFARRWLDPLTEYDRLHRSELVETLRQVFRARNLSGAAAALHIHISTLKYRIGRIEDILGRSVEDWDNVFNLELAMRILAVSEHLTPPER